MLAPPQSAWAAAGAGPLPITEPDSSASDTWQWPVPQPAQVTRPFDLPHRYAAGHRGIDIAAAPGTTVTAVGDGKVRFVGVVVDRPLLSIEHPSGLISTYEPVISELRLGDAVTAGSPIGTVPEHPVHQPDGGLHLGARIGDSYVDPLSLLARPPRAVLLPLGD